MNCEIIPINESTWRIEDGGVRLFLLAGSEKALLIDSGMNLHTAREVAAELTSLPLSLLNTHADCPISPDLIVRLRDGALDTLAGKIAGRPTDFHGNRIVVYDLGFCSLLCGS